MKKFIILAVLLFLPLKAKASTDYKCQSECLDNGYMYSYCRKQCSYNNPNYTVPTPSKRTDYQCLNDCTQKGYMYSYCKEYCSY